MFDRPSRTWFTPNLMRDHHTTTHTGLFGAKMPLPDLWQAASGHSDWFNIKYNNGTCRATCAPDVRKSARVPGFPIPRNGYPWSHNILGSDWRRLLLVRLSVNAGHAKMHLESDDLYAAPIMSPRIATFATNRKMQRQKKQSTWTEFRHSFHTELAS